MAMERNCLWKESKFYVGQKKKINLLAYAVVTVVLVILTFFVWSESFDWCLESKRERRS